jgi:hypothetical protein
MKHRIANFPASPTRFINDLRNQRILAISVFVVFFSCMLFLLFGKATRRDETEFAKAMSVTPVSTTPTVTPTKWWVKGTATVLPIPSSVTAYKEIVGISARDCPSSYSSPLQSGIYAYISPMPRLPNRIRSGAGKEYSYLGQIEPGDGVKVLDGPLCADGFSWWLVESTQAELRGWTAEGRESEQWVIPCPQQTVACNKTLSLTPTSAASPALSSRDRGQNNPNKCKSEKLTTGILALVLQDSLLVIRSEPNNGDAVGRAGPSSVVNIIDGPSCAGGAVWFKVNIAALHLSGWATEHNLYACSKEDDCD